MPIIKSKTDLGHISDRMIAQAIKETILSLEQSYGIAYEATQLGWFFVCEDEQELLENLPNLNFSIHEKIHLGDIEYVEKKPLWYEVYILLNDNEGILIYVPMAILSNINLS